MNRVLPCVLLVLIALTMSLQTIAIISTSDLFYDQRLQRVSFSFEQKGWTVRLWTRDKKISSSFVRNQQKITTLFQRGPLFYFEYNMRLILSLIGIRYNVLYVVDSDCLMAGIFLKILRRKTMVFDSHEFFEESPELANKPVKKWIWAKLTQRGVRLADLCITVSESLAQKLESKYDKRFYCIRNLPVKRNYSFSDPEQPFKKIIWYQGVLNIGRGLEQMISAMQELPEYELHLAGEGDLSSSLRDLCKTLHLEDRVKFYGWLDADAMFEHASKAWIGINLLSDDNLNYTYSLANKTFDYIQAGLPAIHMDFPEYQKIQEVYGGIELIRNLETAEILRACRKLQKNENYQKLKTECKSASKELYWEAESKKLIALIQNLP